MKDKNLTIHCIIEDKAVYEHITEGKTAIKWIWDAINGQVKSYGIELLNEK